MKKFLNTALKSQWKTIVLILVLIIIQTVFQMEIIELFSTALSGVKKQNINLLIESGSYMLLFTLISMVAIYSVSILSVRVSSKAAFNVREKIFHILMNLPEEEVNQFKITGLTSRSTRGIYSEQGFIILLLEQLMVIPIAFIGILYEIAWIDLTFAIFFAAFIIILTMIVAFRLNLIIEVFFRAKKTYGKLNKLFLTKINTIVYKIPVKKQESMDEFEKACEDSYDKNVKYLFKQYYLGQVLLWILYAAVLILFALVNSGYSIGFETDSIIDSFIILLYVAYFVSTLVVIPTFIDRWPRSYATSVRLEEVLNLEDKVIESENTNENPETIEISEEDINDDKSMDIRDVLDKFSIILKEDKVKVIISMILVMVSTLCIVYAPKIAGKTVDLMASNANSSNDVAIYTNLALLLVLYSIGYLIKLPSKKTMGVLGEKVAYNLRMDMFDKVDNVSSRFIKENSKGQIFSRLNNDLMNIREFVSTSISEIYAQILTIILVIVLILLTDFRLSLIYIAALPIYSICFYLCDVKSKAHFDNHQKQLGRMMSYFERSLSNRSSFHEKGFVKFNHTVIDHYIKSRNTSNIMVPITNFLTNATNITVYMAGIYLLAGNEIQLGTLLAVIMYGKLMTKPIKKLSKTMITIETIFSSVNRVFGIIDYKNDG